MSREQRLRLEMEALYPLLGRFLGGYLHEDWPIISGTPEKAVDDAIADYPVPLQQQVRRELVSLLQRCGDDSGLSRILNDGLGVYVHFSSAGEARAFAADIERKLLESIQSHFQDQNESQTP